MYIITSCYKFAELFFPKFIYKCTYYFICNNYGIYFISVAANKYVKLMEESNLLWVLLNSQFFYSSVAATITNRISYLA